jgi:transposase
VGIYWATRVPHSIKEAKSVLVQDETSLLYQELENGYKVSQSIEKIYKGKSQRWVVVYSGQKHQKDKATLDKKIEQEAKEGQKKLWHLSNQMYNCKKDAHALLKPLKQQLKYHLLTYQIEEVYHHAQAGRPKKEATKELSGYKIVAKLEPDQKVIQAKQQVLGKFILATNQLDKEQLSESSLLKEYKDQQYVEAGFAFIKKDAFEISSIFLKKPSRISALMMVMTLCLLIYNLATYFLHQAMEEKGETLPNQLNKEVKKPSLAYVLRKFHGIAVVKINFESYQQEIVVNIKALHRKIIHYFGVRAEKIYGLAA